MNLDNLKELYNKEEITETPEISLEEQKEIHSPLEKIRKNMRMEFWYTILTYPIVIAAIAFVSAKFEQGNILNVLILLSCLICGYYFLKFRSLYQKINTQDFSTFHKLLNLRYELVLNTELYKSYYMSYVPIIFCAYFVIYGVRNDSLGHLFFIILITLFASVLMWFFGKLWLREFYGKYIVEISDRVMELSDEKDDFVYDRKSLKSDVKLKAFRKTSDFFERKLGNVGVLVNYLLWGFILFLILMVAAFAIGYIIGYLSIIFK